MFLSTPENFAALNACVEATRDSRKSLFFWIGAGASAWCGLPLWSELAEKMYQRFQSQLKRDQREQAQSALESGRFPAFFSLCKAQDPQLYLRTIIHELRTPAEAPPVYTRFITEICATKPALIVTTNIDQCLEQHSALPSVLYEDIEQVMRDTYADGCILKLHGCISATDSLIFTQEDYQRLIEHPGVLASLEQLFSSRTAIFIGCGMRDEYVINALERAHSNRPLLGAGPHFCVLPAESSCEIGGNIHLIRYDPKPHRDHRSCIQVIEEILRSRETLASKPAAETPPRRSAHILSDVLLPGTSLTGHTLRLGTPDGKESRLEIGCGFVDSELPHLGSTAMHDAVVGLLCFDQLIAPTTIIGKLHILLGSDIFERLIHEGTLSFVHLERTPGVIFPEVDAVTGGRLTNFYASWHAGHPLPVDEVVQQQIRPADGKEREGAALISSLIAKTSVLSDDSDEILQLVRSLMLFPSVRSDLGFADLVSLESIPTWLVYPILRLASVASIGKVCRELGLSSAKFELGNEWLAGPVFTAAFGKEAVERIAAYVATGRLYGDLGALVHENRGVLSAILSFRETHQGLELRKAVLEHLALSEGGELVAAINGRLSEMLPLSTLERAKAKFSELYLPSTVRNLPAVFLDGDHERNPFPAWRKRSGLILAEVCKKFNVGRYSPCPCGSGERFKFCCEPLIRE